MDLSAPPAGSALRHGGAPFDLGVAVLVSAVYIAITFFAAVTTHLAVGFPLRAALTQSAINVAAGVVVISVGMYCISFLGGEEGLSRKWWAVTVGLMVLIHAALHWVIYETIKEQGAIFVRGGGPYLVLTFFVRGAAILCSVFVYDLTLRKKRLRARTEESFLLALAYRDSEISRLRSQLSPHFLFNALGAIAADSERPRMVERLVASFSDVLRYNLSQASGRSLFGQEVAAVSSYLQIEQARLGDALVIEMAIPAAASSVYVPQPLLLPLVENAIKYGLETSSSVLAIQIGAKVEQGALTVWVENSGKWVEPAPASAGRQLGLANLKRRLELQIGPGTYLKVESLAESVRVSLRIPSV